MSILDFLTDLHSRQIHLWLEGNQLRYRAPKGVLTPELRSQIVARKQELTAFLQEARRAIGPSLPPITPADRDKPLPLSFSQERLWILEQMQEGSSTYAIHAVLGLQGNLDRGTLEEAFREISRRHEILRTSFPIVDGQPVQLIAPDASPWMQYVDLARLPRHEQDARIQDEQGSHLQPFDLAGNSLVRITLLRRAEDEHVLLLTLHHIIADGWSIPIFLEELLSIYRALRAGTAIELAPLPVQYVDIAQWQRNCIKTPVFEELRAYWRTKLAGLGNTEQIRPDFPRPAIRTFQGSRVVRRLPPDLSRALYDRARAQEMTLFMLLLAALSILLMRHSGQRTVPIGTPTAGRTRPELEGLIGCFVNTLVLCTELEDDITLREAFERVRQTTLEAYAHQELPFEQLLADLRVERDPSRTPLFQVFLNMLPFNIRPQQVAGLTLTLLTPSLDDAKFDITLYVEEQDQLQLTLVYNADVFEDAHMHELLEQYQLLLQQIVATPDARVASLSLCTERARAVLPNPTEPLPVARCESVLGQFARQAAQAGDRVAIYADGEDWTYQELETRSNRLAHALRAHGIQAQDRVAIYADRSAALVWAVLGVLKSGAAFCILDPAEPPRWLLSSLHQAQPRAWITAGRARPLLAEIEAWIETGRLAYRADLPAGRSAAESCFAGYPGSDPGCPCQPEDIAYIAFTSGSTGHPKGVIGTHGPLAHFVRWQRETFGLHQADRFTLLSGLAHDPLLRDIFTPLSVGAAICIPAERDLQPERLLPWLLSQHITVMHATPSTVKFFFPDRPDQPSTSLPLRYLFFGGEPLNWHDVSRLRQYAPAVACINFYGLTETPQAMAYHHLSSKQEGTGMVPIGRGIDGAQLLILNADSRLAGIGEIGEISIRTPYLSLGYLGDDALTRSRFVINPYTQSSTDHLHRTGDRGYYRLDGAVQYVGRADRQVKIRGFRVEPGEIEHCLFGHPSVRHAYVVARSNAADQQALVAYLVLANTDITDTELRQYLGHYVPGYMIPSAFIRLTQMPMTANGKVDPHALPAYIGERPQLTKAYETPSTPREQHIAAIWSQVLGVHQIGRHDNFFELGGHSLSATLIFHRLEEQFGTQLPMRALFENPTVAGIARLLDEQPGTPHTEAQTGIRPLARGTDHIADLLAQLQSIAETPLDRSG